MPVMLIAAPEDLMIARVRDVEDRILWVLKKGTFGPAIELALLNRHLLTQQRVRRNSKQHKAIYYLFLYL